MRCDECLLLIDEYVCDELEGPDTARVSAHLDACAACAGERAALARERRLFARCEVSAPPTLRASVSRRLEEEESPRAVTPDAGPRSWLGGFFAGRLPRPRVAFAAAVALVVVTSLVLLRTARRGSVVRSREGVAAVSAGAPAADAMRTDGEPAPASPRWGAPTEPRGIAANPAEGRGSARTPSDGTAAVRHAPRKFAATETRRGAAVTTLATFEPDAAGADARPRSAAAAEVIYDETARHFERAQMLLRSFKNGGPSERAAGFDLAYERRFSRSLLGRNILLRCEAQSDGDEAAAKLLGQLEPFLLDIANLAERAAPAQVRSIRERMQREGIVARLRLF